MNPRGYRLARMRAPNGLPVWWFYGTLAGKVVHESRRTWRHEHECRAAADEWKGME